MKGLRCFMHQTLDSLFSSRSTKLSPHLALNILPWPATYLHRYILVISIYVQEYAYMDIACSYSHGIKSAASRDRIKSELEKKIEKSDEESVQVRGAFVLLFTFFSPCSTSFDLFLFIISCSHLGHIF